jgi:hypothetical protein
MRVRGSNPQQLPANVPQFFFDDSLIAFQRRLVRRWMQPKIYPEPILKPDRAWEGRTLALYGTVLPDPEGGWHMYYNNFVPHAVQGYTRSAVFLARSRDGFHWEKPDLGIVKWNGDRANNIVIESEGWHLDGPSLLSEPHDKKAPYKLMLFSFDTREGEWKSTWGLYCYTSRDGLRWQKIPGRRTDTGDRTSLMPVKVDGKYVNFTRCREMWETFRGRAIYRVESEDFLNWSKPELVLTSDLLDEPDVEFYGLSAFERHGWYIGLLEHGDSLNDCVETHLVVSRDTKNWTRTVRRPFIGAAYDWNRKWNICASNGPIPMNEQMVFYFNGRNCSHHWDTAQQHGVIGYASLPLDRFCAIEGTSGGVLETVPMLWPGGKLAIDADARGGFDRHPLPLQFSGEIEIEALDAERKPLPGFSGDNKVVWRGNTHCRGIKDNGAIIRWPNQRNLASLRGKTICLRFFLKRARLFTFEARNVN